MLEVVGWKLGRLWKEGGCVEMLSVVSDGKKVEGALGMLYISRAFLLVFFAVHR
jgi:hypothetical protein